ncbi:MAG: tRNA (N(6)-L-threonylcarbamoyladenosine(37)-C(2))-methylthiotransferase MtaB [Bacteriovoracia bacterium]
MSGTLKRYALRTLGCKANTYDSQLLEAELQARGWVPAREGESADLCLVNSCTVTNEADKLSRKTATRLARLNAGAPVVITGCGAEVDPRGMASTPGLTHVVSNRDKPKLLAMLDELATAARLSQPRETNGGAEVLGSALGYDELRSRHPLDREWPLPDSLSISPQSLKALRAPGAERNSAGRTRAFLKIQEGCNSFCTFCIIPYGRGPSRSLRPRAILEQIQALVEDGAREVVLTGTNVGDYGMEWAPKGTALEELLTMIFQETAIERVRVSSLDPTEITPGLLLLVETEPRMCPHFHVSLQSPHTGILRLMKRGYGFDEVERCLRALAGLKPAAGTPNGVYVGMDLITGFPGETDEIFAWTRDALGALPWTRLHVFPYSERASTPATRLPGSVPVAIRKRRARELQALNLRRVEAHYHAARARHGNSIEDVLIESPHAGPNGAEGWWMGHTRDYLRVLVEHPGGVPATFENTVVTGSLRGLLRLKDAGEAALLASFTSPLPTRS